MTALHYERTGHGKHVNTASSWVSTPQIQLPVLYR